MINNPRINVVVKPWMNNYMLLYTIGAIIDPYPDLKGYLLCAFQSL